MDKSIDTNKGREKDLGRKVQGVHDVFEWF